MRTKIMSLLLWGVVAMFATVKGQTRMTPEDVDYFLESNFSQYHILFDQTVSGFYIGDAEYWVAPIDRSTLPSLEQFVPEYDEYGYQCGGAPYYGIAIFVYDENDDYCYFHDLTQQFELWGDCLYYDGSGLFQMQSDPEFGEDEEIPEDFVEGAYYGSSMGYYNRWVRIVIYE